MVNSGKNWRLFVPRELEIWWMTLKNNRAPLLYYIKLCVAFQSHWHIQTGVAVRKRSIRFKIGNFLSRVTLKIDIWPWKTIGHLFYITPSFVHNFKSIGEVKLELQPANAQVGWQLVIFFCSAWPWNRRMLLLHLCIIPKPMVNSNRSYSPETPNLGQNQRFF